GLYADARVVDAGDRQLRVAVALRRSVAAGDETRDRERGHEDPDGAGGHPSQPRLGRSMLRHGDTLLWSRPCSGRPAGRVGAYRKSWYPPITQPGDAAVRPLSILAAASPAVAGLRTQCRRECDVAVAACARSKEAGLRGCRIPGCNADPTCREKEGE